MNAPQQVEPRQVRRGAHLVHAGGGLARNKPGRFSRLVSPGFQTVMKQVDRGLEYGAIEGHLPDGTVQILGGRGPGPLAIIHLRDWRALIRLALSGSVGWYEAYARGEWDSPDPVQAFDLFSRNGVTLGATARSKGPWRWLGRLAHWFNRNSRSGSARNIHAHYDLGNDFYALWLDETMSYSSGYFANGAKTLEQAQRDKIVTIVDRLNIKPGDKVLEIGCGWGSLAQAMADQGADVTGITLSEEQLAWARAYNGVHKDRTRFEIRDYRDVDQQFDAIASVEMVEAVGESYWPAYLDCIARSLKPSGRAAIQYIGMDEALFPAYAKSADFIQTYIFPGGMLLSESKFRALAEQRGLGWHDVQRFGVDYAETLKLWCERFDDAVAQGKLPSGFDEDFIRLWRYYLMYCEGGFRGGGIYVAQVTLIKKG